MRTFFDCIPCFVRQALDSVRLITDDQQLQEQVLRQVLEVASKMDLKATPPEMAKKIHRIIRQLTEKDDPYRESKKVFNDFALDLYPKYKRLVDSSENPFETAVRLAIAGNIIDLGVKSSLSLEDAKKVIDHTLEAAFYTADLTYFQNEIKKAKDILYLADNAGEIVFDRLLIEQIGPEKITLVVKGSPVINDATLEDAKAAGLTEIVKVIDNGDDAPGTVLKSCSEGFIKKFEDADLVISKGQGNFETLNDVAKNMFFILKVKCQMIAKHLDCPVGTLILKRSQMLETEHSIRK